MKAPSRGAVISRVAVTAAHDGATELVVTLRHGNGGESDVKLDEIAAAALFESCRSHLPEDLIGHGWKQVREALRVSWNRFAKPPTGGSLPCST